MDAIKIHDLFDLTHTRAEKMLAACEYPWEALSQIGETVLEIGRTLDLGAYDHPAADVWIAKSATVAATAEQYGQQHIHNAAGAGNSAVMIFGHYCCTSLRRVK